jgi:dihydrofolate reductase
MATVYYTASSLDGYIVDEHESLAWLVTRDIDVHGSFGYEAFAETVGALAMGATTYEWILANQPGEWMYSQPTWVLTHRRDIVAAGHPVTVFDGDVTDLHAELVAAADNRHVWIVGGGQTAQQFVAKGLVDEMIVSYAPCTLGAGAPLLPMKSEWVLKNTGVNGEFLCAQWAFKR